MIGEDFSAHHSGSSSGWNITSLTTVQNDAATPAGSDHILRECSFAPFYYVSPWIKASLQAADYCSMWGILPPRFELQSACKSLWEIRRCCIMYLTLERASEDVKEDMKIWKK